MNFLQVLEVLAEKRIKVSVHQGELRVRAAKGLLTPELTASLREHKPELLRHLGRPALERVERAAPQPLSLAQERLWFMWKLEPDGYRFHMPLCLRLRGARGSVWLP